MESCPSSSIENNQVLEENYDFAQIETALQAHWRSQETYKVDTQAPIQPEDKFYCLAMFPYPSGNLHMGHVRNYTINDIIARIARLSGQTVLYPMGWDAFGLPAENAAIQNNVPPALWTVQNMQNMRAHFERLGLSIDWSKELATCDPDYYKWEQWLFLQMYEKGLVYKKNAIVNWDPVDKTVLANEQVIDGKGWRSGAQIEQRQIPQWFLKITYYADQLLDDLDLLEGWPERVKTMQRHWIGRSQGATIQFALNATSQSLSIPADFTAIEVFTTRPDTLYGATFLAIAPQHPLAVLAAKQNPQLQDLMTRMSHIKTAEADMATLAKEGCDTGFTAQHPLTGQAIPIWVANYVLATYGSGAVMCVPAHDQRDWEFASLYALTITPVIQTSDDWDYTQGANTGLGHLINSCELNGLSSAAANSAITDALAQKKLGQAKVEYRLRDWGVSRQRYWGTPIPLILCKTCGDVPVPLQDLPVVLPDDNLDFSGEDGSPLDHHATFKHVSCPKCGGAATRETDTFDTFMESSWYYARFTCPDEQTAMLGQHTQAWTPIDQYVGGIEHATMHLLYSRFIHKVLRDLGLVTCDEPFKKLLCQGMVLSESFHRTTPNGEKIYINRQDISFKTNAKGSPTQAIETATGLELSLGTLEKMSKSKNNGVDPTALINQYGADTVRVFSMFAAPPEQNLEWSDTGVEGAARFLKRYWKQAYQHNNQDTFQKAIFCQAQQPQTPLTPAQQEMRFFIHTALEKVTDDYQRRQSFNTGIAALMKLSNQLSSFNDHTTQGSSIRHEGLCILTLMLSPIAPHITTQIWRALEGSDIEQQPWPKVDATALQSTTLTLVIQINGKKRSEINVDADISPQAIEQLVLADATTTRFIGEQTVVKVIYVPGRLVNVVVR